MTTNASTNNMKPQTRKISFDLTEELYEKLTNDAYDNRMSRAAFIRKLIIEFMNK